MNKKLFIIELSKHINKSQKETKFILNKLNFLFLDVIKKCGKIKTKVGTFKLIQKNERIYFNPHTRCTELALAKKTIVFKMSKQLL